MAKQRSKKKSGEIIAESNEFGSLDGKNEVVEEASSAVGVSDSDLDDLLENDESENDEESRRAIQTRKMNSNEVAEKLEKFSNLEKHCVELEKSNSALTDSIGKYLEEIECLKKKIESLEKEKSAENDSKVKELEELNIQLQEENDNYLVKLSELSFDNAKLTSELQLFQKDSASASSTSNSSFKKDDSKLEKPHVRNVDTSLKNSKIYINPYLNNGYSTWN